MLLLCVRPASGLSSFVDIAVNVIVVVVAAARDDELLALHPDPSVARVGALDVLDDVRVARRDADVAADVAFPLVADRGAVFAYAAARCGKRSAARTSGRAHRRSTFRRQ